jgi:hypothetical protein
MNYSDLELYRWYYSDEMDFELAFNSWVNKEQRVVDVLREKSVAVLIETSIALEIEKSPRFDSNILRSRQEPVIRVMLIQF